MAEKPSKNLESLYTSIYTLSCLKKGRSKFNLQWNYGPISTEGQKKKLKNWPQRGNTKDIGEYLK